MISAHWLGKFAVAGLLVFAVAGCGGASRQSGTTGGSPGMGGLGTGGFSTTGGTTHALTGGAGNTGTGGDGSHAGGMSGGGGTAGASNGARASTTGGGEERGGSAGAAGQTAAGSGGSDALGSGGSGGLSKESGGQGGQASGGIGQAGRGATGGQGGAASGQGGAAAGQRSVSFGTLLDAQAVISSAQQLAKTLANPNSPQWRAKGDQHRTYRFSAANRDEPYRLCVPSDWDGKASLRLAMFLHGAGNDESSYLDQNNKQIVTLAAQHGLLLVSPLGDSGAYGNFLRLSAPFGNEAGAAELMAQVTADSERTNELSEKDVINVLELVLNEYPIDRGAMFLFGHSMGSGGTWYIGGKYASYWKGIAPMSGPFVQKTGYPWESVRPLSLFVSEGTQAPSLAASRLLRDWLTQNGFQSQYLEVNADHPGMVSLVVPRVFDFFDSLR